MRYKRENGKYYYSYRKANASWGTPEVADEKSFEGLMKTTIKNNPEGSVTTAGEAKGNDIERFKKSSAPEISSEQFKSKSKSSPSYNPVKSVASNTSKTQLLKQQQIIKQQLHLVIKLQLLKQQQIIIQI